MNATHAKGSALYLVLIFSITAIIATTLLLKHYYSLALTQRKIPAQLQALLNARTGAWFAVSALRAVDIDTIADTNQVSEIAEIDNLFGGDMFSDQLTSEEDSILDQLLDTVALFGNFPAHMNLYDSLKFGFFTISLTSDNVLHYITSIGEHRGFTYTVSVDLGSRPFTNPDTVIYLYPASKNTDQTVGPGFINGTVAFFEASIDSSDSTVRRRFQFDKEEISRIQSEMEFSAIDSGEIQEIKEDFYVEDNDEFDEMPDTVLTSLYISGESRDLEYNKKRTIVVMGDLQITGTVKIKGMHFLVNRDIKLRDKTKMDSVVLFTNRRMFFSNNTEFHGHAVAHGEIQIYDESKILNKSIIISTGLKVRRGGRKGIRKEFSFLITHNAQVDGICINLNRRLGIYTEMETKISGILWSYAMVAHYGELDGVIYTKRLVSKAGRRSSKKKNVVMGTIRELKNIHQYILPYYIGQTTILYWNEL